MAELLNVECDATRRALTEAGRPNCTIRLGEPNEENLGYLLQALEVQTAIAGTLYGVNAFDQPGVEAGKQITYKRMGKARVLEQVSTLRPSPSLVSTQRLGYHEC